MSEPYELGKPKTKTWKRNEKRTETEKERRRNKR
jgi:hypothetical protein